MRRLLCVALAFLMAMAYPLEVVGQTLTQAAQDELRRQEENRQTTERFSRALEANKFFVYTWAEAGTAPAVLPSELKCVSPSQIGFSEVHLVGMGESDYDKCTEKGLEPISVRLRKHFSLALYRNPDTLSDAEWTEIKRQAAQGLITSEVIEPKTLSLDLGLTYRSRPPYAVTSFPPVPDDFRFHAYVLPGVIMKSGPYAGRTVQLIVTRTFERDGVFKEPCVNITGRFHDRGVFTTAQPASAAEQFPPQEREFPPAVPVSVEDDRRGMPGWIWPVIGAVAGALVCVAICRGGDKIDKLRPIVPEPRKGEPGTPGNPGNSPGNVRAGIFLGFGWGR